MGAAYYAVARGRLPGVYSTWAECEQQVKGFSGACYKKFATLPEAQAFNAQNGGSGKAVSGGSAAQQAEARKRSHEQAAATDTTAVIGLAVASTSYAVPAPKQQRQAGQQAGLAGQQAAAQRPIIGQRPIGVPWQPMLEAAARGQQQQQGVVQAGAHAQQQQPSGRLLSGTGKHSSSGSGGGGRGISNDTRQKYGQVQYLDPRDISAATAAVNAPAYRSGEPNPQDPETLVAFCDGSAINNGSRNCRAGWACVFPHHPEWDRAAPLLDIKTNNRAEYLAATEAMRRANEEDPSQIKPLYIFSDSKLLIRSMTEWVAKWRANNWRKADGEPVLNRDLLEGLLREQGRRRIIWRHVKAHTGGLDWESVWNDKVDRLARQTALQGRPWAGP